MKRITFWYVFLSFCFTPLLNAGVESVSSGEETRFLRHLMPLPHEISIQRKAIVKPSDVSIIVRKNASDIEQNAAREIENMFCEKTDSIPSGKGFTILIGIVDKSGKLNGIPVTNIMRLKDVPNNDQAYIIRPENENTLILAGLSGKGVYYAAVTLCQLIEPYLTKDSVIIPLPVVLDWPDMEERGIWNFDRADEWIPWMASVKLNYGKMVATQLDTIERGKPNELTIDRDLMMKARLMAFNYLPFIMHYNFLHDYGLFKEYPELAGVGDGALSGRYFAHKLGNQHRVPCTSNPLFTKILTEWMMSIASQGADEVSCWLSERPAQCGCKACTAIGQFVLEARASVNAWRETQKTYPDFTIRLFISTTTSEHYYRILAETPPEVKIERCCASWIERVTHIPRDLYVDPLFDSYAAEGRWIASYDVPLGAYGRVDTPEYKIPCSSAHRIRDYVSHLVLRKWKGAYGMLAWGSIYPDGDKGKETWGFNASALAEWSWNLKGRSEREFAIAWATREGYENPESVGDWSDIMGPIEFDVYDSEFPVIYSWGQAVRMVETRTRPYLGEGMFRYYLTPDEFDRKIASCDSALAIAGQFDIPHLANETRVVRSYIDLAKSIYLIADQVATDDLATLESQSLLSNSLVNLETAGKENVAAIKQWRSAMGPEPWHHRVYDAIKGTETTVREISDTIAGKYLF